MGLVDCIFKSTCFYSLKVRKSKSAVHDSLAAVATATFIGEGKIGGAFEFFGPSEVWKRVSLAAAIPNSA